MQKRWFWELTDLLREDYLDLICQRELSVDARQELQRLNLRFLDELKRLLPGFVGGVIEQAFYVSESNACKRINVLNVVSITFIHDEFFAFDARGLQDANAQSQGDWDSVMRSTLKSFPFSLTPVQTEFLLVEAVEEALRETLLSWVPEQVDPRQFAASKYTICRVSHIIQDLYKLGSECIRASITPENVEHLHERLMELRVHFDTTHMMSAMIDLVELGDTSSLMLYRLHQNTKGVIAKLHSSESVIRKLVVRSSTIWSTDVTGVPKFIDSDFLRKEIGSYGFDKLPRLNLATLGSYEEAQYNRLRIEHLNLLLKMSVVGHGLWLLSLPMFNALLPLRYADSIPVDLGLARSIVRFAQQFDEKYFGSRDHASKVGQVEKVVRWYVADDRVNRHQTQYAWDELLDFANRSGFSSVRPI